MKLEDGSLHSLYADAIYRNTLIVTRRIEDPEGYEEEMLNSRMNCARQSIELLYGDTMEKWQLLNKKRKFRLFKTGKEMYAIVLTAFFLNNCHTCYQGNKVQGMHCAEKPDIENYININEELDMVEWDSDEEF